MDFFSSSSSVPATSVQLLQQQQSQQQQYETFNDFGDDDDFFNPKPAPALRREEVKERGRGASTEDPFAAVSSDPFADTPSTARRKLREMYDIHEDEELEQEGDDDDDEEEVDRHRTLDAGRSRPNEMKGTLQQKGELFIRWDFNLFGSKNSISVLIKFFLCY